MSKTEDKDRKTWINKFYNGLKVLDEYSFPKVCSNCGKRYETVDDFIIETDKVNHPSGLTSFNPRNKSVVVGLYRNCVCHSTLMGTFKDRRDTSEQGIKARKEFDKLLEMLHASGMELEEARTELLKYLRGETSVIPWKLNL